MSYQTGPSPLSRPAHSLDYWLSVDLSAITPASARSRLRELASARGSYMGAWAAGIGIGAAIALFCSVFYVRARDRLPKTSRALVNRGPGSLRGALSFVGFILTVFIGLSALTAKPSTWQDPTHLLTLGTVLVFLVCLLVAAIIVPATIVGRSRESLRRKAAKDPHFRALLEQDLATWRDPYGDARYGPL